MSQFGANRGEPTMQRRGAVMGGGSPQKSDFGSRGGGNNFGNSFASRGGGGASGGNKFGQGNRQQPLIDGDFLSENQSDNFGAASQSYGGGFNRAGGGSGSRFGNRPPTGEGQYSGGQGGRFGGAGGSGGFGRGQNAPSSFEDPYGGGNQGRLGSGTSNMARTFNAAGGRPGFGAHKSQGYGGGGRGGGGGFGGRGGRGGGDSGMNRYGSQQSLAYSQNSYGNQDGGGRFGTGGGGSGLGMNRFNSIQKMGPNQMGRTMGNSFRPPTGGNTMGRQNSIAGGGFQNRFSGTMNSRMGGPQNRSSLGAGGPRQESIAYLDSQNDGRFREIAQELGRAINEACQQQNLQSPEDFFQNYDPFAHRVFEDWELQIMFQLPLAEVAYMIDCLDDDQGSRQVPIGVLFSNLYSFVYRLNITEINRNQKSIWEQKKKMLNRNMQEYVKLAEDILQTFSQYGSYKEAFDMIMDEKMQELNDYDMQDFQQMQQNYLQAQYNPNELRPFVMPSEFLESTLERMAAPQTIRTMIEYIILGRNTDQIFVVHFVRALQVLKPDSLTRAPRASSPDLLIHQSSIDQSMHMMEEGLSLDQMLMKVPESLPNVIQNPIMKTVAEHLDANSSEMAKLESDFPSARKMTIKAAIGTTTEAECCSRKDFEAFLRNLKVVAIDDRKDKSLKDKPLLEPAQINVLFDLYAVELPVRNPQVQPGIPPRPSSSLANANVEEAQPEQEQDQPEGAQPPAAQEEQKGTEEEKKGQNDENPFKRADTDFERAESVEQFEYDPKKPEEDAKKPAGAEEAKKPVEDAKQEEPMIVDQAEEETKKKAAADATEAAQLAQKADLPVASAAKEEQKEGGEPEFYEGGDSELINLQKFKNDLSDINKMTRDKAKELIIQIFERIKKWITLTTKSIKLLFKNQDKKRKLEANENDLRMVLNKAVRPFKLERKHLQAVLQVMGNGEILRYGNFTSAFFAYANQKKIYEDHRLSDIVQAVHDFTEGKSLVELLSRTDDRRIREEPDFKFEVPFKTFTEKIKRHRGRVKEFDRQQEVELEKLITDTDKPGVVDLVKLQELLGFKEQEIYNVEENQYRKIVMNLQIQMLNFEQLRQMGLAGARVRTLMPKGQLADNWINNQVIDVQSEEDYNQLMGMMQEYDDGHQNDVNVQKFMGRIEREMTKYAQIQRFYLLIMKKKDDRKKKMHIEFEDIEEFLVSKGLDPAEQEISVDDFKALLLEMNLIGSKDENWDYFREEFFPEAEPKVDRKKFEDDFKEISEHINLVVDQILRMMDDFCKDELNKKDGSLKEQLSRIQRINQVQLLSSERHNQNYQENQSMLWLHVFDFQRWFQTQIVPHFYQQYNPDYDREVLNVFTLYMSRSEEQKHLIYLPFILQTYIERFPDRHVEQELSQEALPTLIRYICKVLDRINKRPKEYFSYKGSRAEYQFLDILKDAPFYTADECEFPTSLESVIKNATQINNFGYVDVRKFKALLKEQITKMTIRSQELLKIRKQLDERGVKIEKALEQVKGSNDKIEDQGIELIDFAQLCKIAEVKLDPQTQLIPIMDTFDKNLFGEIPAVDLINAFNNAHIGMFEDEEAAEDEPLVNAKRYFVTPQEIILEMCSEIEDRNMTDFGSLLKGNDLFNEGKISHQRFFQVCKSVFSDTIGEGDILDVIKVFDAQNTGSIQIRQVAHVLNQYIRDRANQIKLVSWVDECVEENIVEPVSPRSKAKKDAEDDIEMPEHYRKQMLLDIHCGALVKSAGDLYIWFNSYTSFKAGELNKNEFVIGLERLGVEDTLKEKEEAFKYFLKKVAKKNDNMTEFNKKPIIQQSLAVQDLGDILNEDMPAISMQVIQDRLLWKIATWLTEKKFPIVDVLKNYEAPHEGQQIDVNTFAVNVIEEDLDMKDLLTRNMIQVLVKRYDGGEAKFDYRNFTNDLEILEETNRATIRIFKTQAEINFFQTQGLDDNMDAESYKRNRVLVEPLKEPVYESLTHKNTFYKPPLEELSGYLNSTGTIQNNFMMMEGNNTSMERPMTPPNQAPRPQLDFVYQGRIDELIMQTRIFGVSIEGYFQRFGKFSTQDGIRKVDNKQFCTAIVNLDGMEWAKENHNEMDNLFDAIIIAFENFNQTKQSLQFNNTLGSNPASWDNQSSPDKDVALDQGVPKLTLEQLGQIAYHNSSINLDTMEALVLQNLHAILYENGMLDKLQDMVTFMNWERDSSCQLIQFKNLLLDTMKLRGKIEENRLSLLLQRYRQDEYETMKIQRNDLANLNSDQRTVIKQAFANVDKQLIQILGCYHDLGYQQRKIGIKDQWAGMIAEDIVKAYQVKLFEDRQLPMTENDVASQMHAYFLRMCQSHADTLTFTDFSYIMTSMQLWDGQVHPRSRLEDFFKLCQKEEVSESSFFTPNTIDVSQLVIQQYIPTQQFVRAFEFLSRKPLGFMYQEVIDKFYVISKRQNISIWGHTIVHMFDYDDLAESGYIEVEHFVLRIQEFLNRRAFRGNAVVTSRISDHDLRFLATKYMQRDGSGMVHYVGFLDDYDRIEQSGLGGTGMNQLSLKDTVFRRDQALKQTADTAQTWRVKTLSELTPPESKTMYEKMGRYLQKKGLVEPLCLSLVNIDPERDGFLEKHLIGDVVSRQGMKLSFKQLTLLTQVLIMNAKQEHSYLEMIALLAGEAMMYQVMRENNIQFGGAAERPKKIDMSLLKMSQELKDQIELKYNLLTSHVQSLTRGSQQIRDQELFKVLKEADISFDMADIDVLEQYLTFQRNKENNTISFRVFLDHFQIQTFTSDMLIDIVRQLTEKKVVIEEVTSQRRFTFDEFRELLTRVGVRITDDKVPTLQKLFEQMAEGQEDLSRARMIECFGTEFTNIGKPQEKQRKNNRTLPEPPYAVNSLLAFLVNRKINVMQVFAESLQSKRIRIVQLRELLDQYNYPLEAGDFEVIVKFFRAPAEPAPSSARGGAGGDTDRMRRTTKGGDSRRDTFNRSRKQRDHSKTMKQRSSPIEADDTLNLGKIVAYARRVDPNYGKDEAVPEGARGASKTMITSFPQRIKQILKKFSDYMIDNQIAKEALFEELDRNNDGRIAQQELIWFTQTNQMIEGVQISDLEMLFSFLDSNQDGSISINEFCLLVQGITLSIQARMKSFSFEFDAKLKTEIETLFDRLDTDRNLSLTADELVQMTRPTDQSGAITLERAHAIIRQLDTDGNGRISKVEFVKYFMPRQKRQILDFEDQMEDLRRLFKEQIAEGVASDPTENRLDLLNNNQFITKDGLKSLIVKAGYKEISGDELDSIFTEMDADKNGTIDIDEFIAFIQVADRVKTKNTQARDAVFSIRKARLKLNSLDLFEMFLKMPLSFLPSFSMREIENKKHHLPIHGIQFHFNHQSMSYTGLEKIRDLRLKRAQTKLYIAQYKPSVGLEIQLTGDAVNVPLIQRLKAEYELPHCEVRVVLFDMVQKVYLSNFYILGAEAIRKSTPKNKNSIVEDQKSANLKYDSNLSSFYIASDQAENVNASLVFEFVIYGNNTMAVDPTERKEKSNQITVGWTHVPIPKLSTTVKHKIDLKGGNPFQEQELFTSEDAEQPKQSKGILKKIFGGGGSDGNKIQRYLTLEAKPMSKLPEAEQLELSSLPSSPQSCIVCKPLLSLAVTFRNHCYVLLTKHEQEMTQPTLDLVMVQFPKIYNSPDFQAVLADCWSGTSFAGADAGIVSDAKLERLRLFVHRAYSVMFEHNVKLDPVYPTRSSPLNQRVYRARSIALKQALMGDDETFMAKVRQEILVLNTVSANEGVQPAAEEPQDGATLFMEDYVPFGMGELCGNFNGFDGDDAIAGLSVQQEQNVNEMERKYAADGLYI